MIKLLLSERAKDSLICDANHPLISAGKLLEEIIIYSIAPSLHAPLLDSFASLCGKAINLSTEVSTLSGGQKVILMFLLALYSPAPNILFVDLPAFLDPGRREGVLAMIGEFSIRKTILLESST
ncbi:MAG: hypothetical protein U1B83_06920 [Candidatus Cloacimonadaceae bacterium]|nr:hypothetical protein [Candidatus Cloacimonadaceae bacterium]